MQKIQIYVADDHKIVAEGISNLLYTIPRVTEVKTFPNGLKLFEACKQNHPSLIFLDIEMPIWDGRKTLVELKKEFPAIPCLILSMINEKAIIEECIDLGASAYLNKDCEFYELNEAVEKVLMGENFISKECLKSLANFTKKSKNTPYLTPELSEREKEILALLCDGLSPKEIAEKIFLSHRTVETHKTNIMQKFEVNSIGRLISIALKNGIV